MGSLPAIMALYTEHPEVQYMALVTMKGDRKGCVQPCSEASALSPTTNFVVEHAKDQAHMDCVHIRSPYNNKYLRRESEESQLVAAAASEPVEDTSKWNCTLFLYRWKTYHNSMLHATEVSFFHIGGHNFQFAVTINLENLWEIKKVFEPVRGKDSFVIVDVGSIVRLPKRVTFKGDNDRYLRSTLRDEAWYNEFTSNDNAIEESQYDIIPNKHGNISVRSLHFKKFLRVGSNKKIWGNANNPTADTLFEVIKVGGNCIALRNITNGNFCQRHSVKKDNNCLYANATSVVRAARLVVEEPVFERKIKVNFRLQEARIYDTTPLQAATATVVNRTNKETTLAQGFNYTKTHTASWNINNCLKFGFKMHFKSGIPFLLDLDFRVSGEVDIGAGSYGESIDYSQQITSTYTVIAPAMTKAIVKGLAQQAKYDIPFSYYVTDSYTNGEKVSTLFEDGMYNGVETFGFHYEAKYEALEENDDKIPGAMIIK